MQKIWAPATPDCWRSGDTTPCRMTGVALHSHVRVSRAPERSPSARGGGGSPPPASDVARLTFKNCCRVGQIDIWQPLLELWRGQVQGRPAKCNNPHGISRCINSHGTRLTMYQLTMTGGAAYDVSTLTGPRCMAAPQDATTRTGVASPVTTNLAAKGSVFVNLRNGGNSQNWPTIYQLSRDRVPFFKR